MISLRPILITLGIIVLLLLYTCVFTLSEGEKALMLRLGEIVKAPQGSAKIYDPGLHFKWPIINQTRVFDVRLQTMPVESSRVLTLDQKYVLVDYYIKWQIQDLSLYYQRTGGFVDRAQTLLEQQVNDALRTAFGQHTLTEMVAEERVNVMLLLTQSANQTAKNLGIKIVDVRIKSIDLPKEVSERVFNQMRSKREQVATQLRAEGKAKAEAIKAEADAKAVVMVAQANKQSADLRAQGLTEAGEIYANVYGRDPGFFAFYRSLEAYRDVFKSKQDILILQPNSQFFKYFNSLSTANAAQKK